MKSLLRSAALAVLLLVGIIIFNLCTYTLRENEIAILTQFGKPVGQPVTSAGLHFKLPVLHTVNRLDGRIREWDGKAVEMPTGNKLYIIVDSFSRWKITDPMIYFTRLRDERSALSRMDDIIGSEVRNAVAKYDLIELVRTDKNRVPVLDGTVRDSTNNPLPAIKLGRTAIEREVTDKAKVKLAEFGIELIDCRFCRLNYHKTVATKIGERMISERQQIASRYRAEGEGEAEAILGNKGRDLSEITSAAYREAQTIKGQGEARAAEIYAKAYNQSKESIELYNFMRAMDTLKKVADNETSLILSTDGDLMKYLKHAKPTEPKISP
jgi:membrane protease subunit HflC